MPFFAEKLTIGNTPGLQSRCLLSPMEGLFSEPLIRTLVSLRLVRELMTPFFSVTGGHVPSPAVLRRKLQFWKETSLPLSVQMMGNDPESLCELTGRLLEENIRSLNLNFACPSPSVISSSSGGALLADPKKIEKLVRAVCSMLPDDVLLSVKLRAGKRIDCTEEVISAAVDGGARLLIFHYRTVREMYDPLPDGLERLSRAVTAAGDVPVVGNGDIHSPADAERMVRSTGCAAVAAARGMLKDPGLSEWIRTGTHPGITVRMFHDEMKRQGAPESALRHYARLAAGTPFL